MAWTQQKVDETYRKVVTLATTDEDFRRELLQNPNMAIERITGESLPENYSIKVIESDPAYFATFVLPPFTMGELSDDELDNVAGGLPMQPFDDCGMKVGK